MRRSIPGIGGSLGECVYCGESFVKEILLGESVRMIGLGGIDFPIHEKECFEKFFALATDGRVQYSVWRSLPEKSPLREELQKFEQQSIPDESGKDEQ
jgi:hypothetical protein